MKKTLFIVGTSILCIFLFSISFLMFLNIYNSKTNTARRYFKSIANLDVEKVYELLNLEDSEFINKDNLEQVLIEQNINSNYSISNVKENNNDVLVEYISDTAKTNSYEIKLEQQDSFIKQWYLDKNMFIVYDYILKIPKEYKVYLDDISLDKYVIDKSDVITYKVPIIFKGFHDLRLHSSSETLNIDLNINESNYEYVYQSKKDNLIYINLKKFIDLYNSKTKKIIVIGSAYCSHCINFKPIMENASYKYNIPVYFIDLSTLTQQEYNTFKEISYIKNNFRGTPTTILVENGEVIDSIIGYTTVVDELFKKIK